MNQKSKWTAKEIDWLGFKITQNGMKITDKKVSEIRDLNHPTNVKEVRSVLLLMSFYRALIPHFAQIAKPLTKMLRKGARYAENQETHKAFDQVREAICSAPIQADGDFRKLMELHCNELGWLQGRLELFHNEMKIEIHN